jgi:hypothetical protein
VKRILLLAVVAVAFTVIGFFLGYMLAKSDEPAVVARNLTRVTIPEVKVETDRGKSYILSNLASHQSRRVKISAAKKDVRVVAKLADGKELTTEKTYVPSEGVLFATISEDAIDLDFEL